MINSIEVKSTGTLIDENITTDLKMEYIGEKPEFINRKNKLGKAINKRLLEIDPEIYTNKSTLGVKLYELTSLLATILRECWKAQDIIMDYSNREYYLEPDTHKLIAEAAVLAQRKNAERNKIIRQIDYLLDEEDYSQLEKSYS